MLTNHALAVAQQMKAQLYVVALKDAVPYWMGLGFVVEEDQVESCQLGGHDLWGGGRTWM